jgi:GTPase SAR1 family protein
LNDKTISLQIWDTAGQERFKSLTTAYYRGSDCCVVVYDVCNEESFLSVKEWVRQFILHAKVLKPEEFKFIIVANKIDSPGRTIGRSIGLKLIDQLNVIINESSPGMYRSIRRRQYYAQPTKQESKDEIELGSSIGGSNPSIENDSKYKPSSPSTRLKSKEQLVQEYVYSSAFAESVYSFHTATSTISENVENAMDLIPLDSNVQYFETSAVNGDGIERVFKYISENVKVAPRSSIPNAIDLEPFPKRNQNCACNI